MKKRFQIRPWMSILVIFLMVPALVLLGNKLGGRSFYLVGVAVILLASAPFFLAFEKCRPQARELVTLAVLSALAVASRAVFSVVPFLKPVLAVIMIAGMAYGPESGFLVGAITAFASNFIFGQGPWTPWQMFAYGTGGFLAGGAVHWKLLPRKPLPMAVFGFVTVLLIVGPILDTCTVFTMAARVSSLSIGSIYLAGLPVNLTHAAATFLTLLLVGVPMLRKLDRINLKYGMTMGKK